mmetsp:Transcript_24956/g.72200  ORF Transcript_24956/g.72200 Transcript_24956/m.72200 type:complete len:264 (+) Transcript_24956:1404-2195(+)
MARPVAAGGGVLGAVILGVLLLLLLLPINLRTASTDPAVVNSVKRKPPPRTAATLANSAPSPMLCARGSVTRLGTKNTGSHLARTAAPGASAPWAASPHPALAACSARRAAKRRPHPARGEGKAMDLAWKRRRTATSMPTRREVEATFRMVSLAVAESASAPYHCWRMQSLPPKEMLLFWCRRKGKLKARKTEQTIMIVPFACFSNSGGGGVLVGYRMLAAPAAHEISTPGRRRGHSAPIRIGRPMPPLALLTPRERASWYRY